MQWERGKKISEETGERPHVSWPLALRAVRGWLEPWIMLRRYWRAWSEQPLPLFSSACLISLGADRGSSSMAPSDWDSSSLFVSSQAHGSPGSSKLDSRPCHAQLPTTGNSRSGLHRDRLPAALALPFVTLLLSSQGAREWVAARHFLSRAAVLHSA